MKKISISVMETRPINISHSNIRINTITTLVNKICISHSNIWIITITTLVNKIYISHSNIRIITITISQQDLLGEDNLKFMSNIIKIHVQCKIKNESFVLHEYREALHECCTCALEH